MQGSNKCFGSLNRFRAIYLGEYLDKYDIGPTAHYVLYNVQFLKKVTFLSKIWIWRGYNSIAMKAVIVFIFFMVAVSLSTPVSSASIRTRDENKQNQYPWYYWNQEGQYPPYYYMKCGAEGVSSLNILSLCVVGLTALIFTGIPEYSKTDLRSVK